MTLSQYPQKISQPNGGPKRLRGLFIMDRDAFDLIYENEHYKTISQMVDLIAPLQTRDTIAANPSLLNDVDLIISGWGMPVVDQTFLKHSPNLQAIFYGSGAVGYFATKHAWDREIIISSAIHANSIPVAEYTLATILFSLKNGWSLARQTREKKTFVPRDHAPGAYGSTIGIVSLGAVARILIELLKPFNLNLIAYDPYITDQSADDLGVKRVNLQELFQSSDAITLHTPVLPETYQMITGKLINSMKSGATLINTSRGSIINQTEMLEVLAKRTDLQAVLDVCDPEPPTADSPIYSLPNVVLTPHIAGSVGRECQRMGQYMVDELRRYIKGEPLHHQVLEDKTLHTSNGPMETFINTDIVPTKANAITN